MLKIVDSKKVISSLGNWLFLIIFNFNIYILKETSQFKYKINWETGLYKFKQCIYINLNKYTYKLKSGCIIGFF